jgi:hypothetical protein
MLANADDGGPQEVFLVMQRAPLSWHSILVIANISSSEELYEKVNDHKEALVDAARRDSGELLSVTNLSSALRRLGFAPNAGFQRRANHSSAEEEISPEEGLEPLITNNAGDGSEVIKQVFAALQRRQRPPPKGGYPFPKNDHVPTKMGKEPPSPCKVCGSAKHWDREFPDWNVYIEKQKRGVLLATAEESDKPNVLYHSAYCVLLEDWVSSSSF